METFMATNNIENATGLSMNWVDDRNASAQSRSTTDLTDWAQSLLDAARSQGHDASLTSMGSGDCGAPVLNVCNKVIPRAELHHREFLQATVSTDSGPTMSGAIESNPGSQAWLTSILTAVRKVDPNASFSRTPEGGIQLNAGGKQVRVNPAEQQLATQQSATLTPVLNAVAPPIRDSINGGNRCDRALDENQAASESVPQASSAYPFQPLPADVLSPDPAIQAWYESILTAARGIDPNATIDNSIGIARVLVNGQQTILTGPMYDEFAQGYATPEQQVNRGVTGTPIALTPEQQMRLAEYQIQSLNNSFSDLSLADAQRQFDAMRPSLNGVPGEANLSIGSQRFPITLQDGKIVLSGPPESWDSIAGNPPPAGPSSTPGPRLVTYANGMQGYVGPDGTAWRDDTRTTTPAWGTTPTPFDGPATLPAA
jgi:hypothetical protein